MIDTWTTEEGYSPFNFYVTSVDEGGRSLIRVNVPSHLHGELTALVQSGKIPEYRTREDVVRDALVHRLIYVARMIGDKRLEEAAVAEMRQADLDMRKASIDRAERYVASLESLMRRALNNDDRAMVAELLEEHNPAHLPEPYRARAIAVLSLFKDEHGEG